MQPSNHAGYRAVTLRNRVFFRVSLVLALVGGETPALLGVVLNRLYTLRNQLIHGGATWNGKVNRKQLRDCTQLLGKLLPVIIELMLDHPEVEWGPACYPVVESI